MSDGYYYLASPYSKYKHGLSAASREAAINAAILIKSGVSVFSPIVHSHQVAVIGQLDALDVNMWLEMDRPLMEAANGCIVLQLDGWDKSAGVAHEIEYFRRAGKPVVYMVPGEMPVMPA